MADEDAKDHIPLTLKEACARYLPGIATPSTLRIQATRGNLKIFRIGRTDCTTIADLKNMVQRCREPENLPVSTSTRREGNGLSETARLTSARDALNQTVVRLKNTSRDTS